ncbi:MAG TPA: YhbY family RNA-binding protein [Gemmatimonadaceae bacterium]|nr:YhbY family RNA-binding protein [Gemmatimonadaceae bacterium]
MHVGHQGLTDTLFQTLDDALRTRELVKVALAKTTDVTAKDAAHQLAERMGADVVQTIGRTCTLFRENPDLKRKTGSPPPWRA